MDVNYFYLELDLLGFSCASAQELLETGSSGHPAERRATSVLSLDFDGTRTLSAVLKTRHGLLILPNLIDVALFSIGTQSVGPAGS